MTCTGCTSLCAQERGRGRKAPNIPSVHDSIEFEAHISAQKLPLGQKRTVRISADPSLKLMMIMSACTTCISRGTSQCCATCAESATTSPTCTARSTSKCLQRVGCTGTETGCARHARRTLGALSVAAHLLMSVIDSNDVNIEVTASSRQLWSELHLRRHRLCRRNDLAMFRRKTRPTGTRLSPSQSSISLT